MTSLKRLVLFLGVLLPAALAAPTKAPTTTTKAATKTPAKTALTALSAPTASAAAHGHDPEIIPGKYIVMLKEDAAVDASAHLNWVRDLHSRSISARNLGGVEKTYNISSWSAYAGEFDNATISSIKKNKDVAYVEPDYMMWPTVVKKRELVEQTQGTWGLGTLSHRTPGSNKYIFDTSAGLGQYAYVVDTGVLTTHEDFDGRASLGYNAAGGKHVDTQGHGTHAAGIIAGTTFGVAKRAKIISVKVFGENSASSSEILDGYQWAVNDIVKKRRQTKAVINMSLGGPHQRVWSYVVKAAHNQGVLTVAAAGNGDDEGNPMPASSQSPASAPYAFTVSSVDRTWKAGFYANYGEEVDIFAPGEEVVSAYIGSNSARAALSGTSMAAPHVAGLVLYLQAKETLMTPSAVMSRIRSLSTKDKVNGNLRGSVNLLAFNGATA